MNVHSSTLHPLSGGAHKQPPVSHGNAARHESGDASFAGELETDHVPPAQAARAALAERADLAGRPFGAIVSLFARHEELPAATAPVAPTAVEPAPADDAGTQTGNGEGDASAVASS